MFTERQAIVIFSFCEGFGIKKIEKIRRYFGSIAAGLNCHSIREWSQTGLSAKEIEKWFDFRKNGAWEERILSLEKNVSFFTYVDDDYPLLLREIHSSPLVLYYKGNWSLLKKKCLAVVGTRKSTDYSKKIIDAWIPALVKNNIVIVSGLALGVDSLAHDFCLKNNGMTVAVLAGGFDQIYPVINRGLAGKILEQGGLLLSEYPPDYKALPFNFPARNRIVSGVSAGVLVTEAPEKSGAMITAYMAIEQNRSVMAVGGNIFGFSSQGCNKLIQQGALFVSKVDDILLELGINNCNLKSASKRSNFQPRSETEAKIYQLLNDGEKCIDELCLLTDLGSDEIISVLNILSLEGYIEELSGGRWSVI
ncbi:MAG: DNA-processing protein DprA [Patescibacteria group bacterium]